MSKRTGLRNASEHPEAATLGNVLRRVVVEVVRNDETHALSRRDRQRLLLFGDVLASAVRGAQPLGEMLKARDQARRALDSNENAHSTIGFADDLPSQDEDVQNFRLFQKVLPETPAAELPQLLSKTHELLRQLVKAGCINALETEEQEVLRHTLPDMTERMAHVNDDLDSARPRRELDRRVADVV